LETCWKNGNNKKAAVYMPAKKLRDPQIRKKLRQTGALGCFAKSRMPVSTFMDLTKMKPGQSWKHFLKPAVTAVMKNCK
jgi:hypothetical protein